MDIFSATSKQTVQTTQPVVDASANTRRSVKQVSQSADTDKKQFSNQDNKQQISNIVKDLNKQMETLDTNVKFGFNDKIDTMFVDVMEKSTGKIIRKIPTEEAMKLSEKMKEIVGVIFDKKG